MLAVAIRKAVVHVKGAMTLKLNKTHNNTVNVHNKTNNVIHLTCSHSLHSATVNKVQASARERERKVKTNKKPIVSVGQNFCSGREGKPLRSSRERERDGAWLALCPNPTSPRREAHEVPKCRPIFCL